MKDLEKIYKKSPSVFLETANENEKPKMLIFNSCLDTIECRGKKDLEKFFNKLEENRKKGNWLAGYFSYEFGYLLEEKLCHLLDKKRKYPLAWFGVFEKPQEILSEDLSFFKKNSVCKIDKITPSILKTEYIKQIKKIKQYLKQGDTYQVNYTFNIHFDVKLNPFGIYRQLRLIQPTKYMAAINTGKEKIFSFSPELFFSKTKNIIITKPMKGTVACTDKEKVNKEKLLWLKKSEKNKAENLMIVDLLRNDLGRIAKKGTVKVKDMFSVERHKTVFQMTSTVEAKTNSSITEIIKAIFPCGSVTGAPKIRTMQIIKELEKEPRHVYTGAVGYISPKNKSCFNVAIRTVHVDKNNKASLGVGSGVVYDSNSAEEYRESFLKAKFFIDSFKEFQIFETILWDKRFYLLEHHLKRLKSSAKKFKIKCELKKIKEKLRMLEKKFNKNRQYKIRIILSLDGKITVQSTGLDKIPEKIKIILSKDKVNSQNQYLYHKTTIRDFYDKQLARAREKGFFEVIFKNEKDELTEGSFTNLFLLKNNVLYTPKLEAGLLPGVLRQSLLEKGQAKEIKLKEKELKNACEIYVGNSVRGLLKVDKIKYI